MFSFSKLLNLLVPGKGDKRNLFPWIDDDYQANQVSMTQDDISTTKLENDIDDSSTYSVLDCHHPHHHHHYQNHLQDLQLYERLTSYNQDKTYCSLVYVIGRGYIHVIDNIHTIDIVPGQSKMVETLFGIVQRIHKEAAGSTVSIIDPSSPRRLQVFLATVKRPKIGEIIKLMDIRIECDQPKSKAIFSSKIESYSSIAATISLNTTYKTERESVEGEEHIVGELRKWYSKKLLNNNRLYNLEQVRPKCPFNIVCKILFCKKFDEALKLVIFDASGVLTSPPSWKNEGLEEDKPIILDKLKNILDPRLKSTNESLLESMCAILDVRCHDLDEKAREIFSMILNHRISILINVTTEENDEDIFRLSLDSFQEENCDIIACGPDSLVYQSFSQRIKELVLTLRRDLSFSSRKRSANFSSDSSYSSAVTGSVVESSPIKRRKTNRGHVAPIIPFVDASVSLSSIHLPEEQEKSFATLNSSNENDETCLPGHSCAFRESYSTPDISRPSQLTSGGNASQLSKSDETITMESNSSNQSKSSIQCSFRALVSMGPHKLKEYRKLVTRAESEVNLNPEISQSQLIGLIDSAIMEINKDKDKSN